MFSYFDWMCDEPNCDMCKALEKKMEKMIPSEYDGYFWADTHEFIAKL